MAVTGQVGEASVRIVADSGAFASELNSGVRVASQAAGAQGSQSLERGFKAKELGAKLGNIVASLFASKIAIEGLKSILKLGSDLAEETNKVQVVFGKAGEEVLKFADTTARAFNISRVDARKFTGEFGFVLTGLGFTEQAAASLSVQLVKLAGDLESFTNIPSAEALAALRSGLTGETEPLKRFGVVLNEASIKQQALNDGIISSVKDALTPQQKALATLNLIVARTSKAQGDAARTADTFAAQSRKLSIEAKDLGATLGTALIPTVTDLLGFLNQIGGVTEIATERLRDQIVATTGIADVEKRRALIVSGLTDAEAAQLTLTEDQFAAYQDLSRELSLVTAGASRFDRITALVNQQTATLTGSLDAAGDAAKRYGDLFKAALPSVLDVKEQQFEIRNAIQDVTDKVRESGAGIGSATREQRDNWLLVKGSIDDAADAAAAIAAKQGLTFAEARKLFQSLLGEVGKIPGATKLVEKAIESLRTNAKTRTELGVDVVQISPQARRTFEAEQTAFLATQRQAILSENDQAAADLAASMSDQADTGAAKVRSTITTLKGQITALLKDIPITFTVADVALPTGQRVPGGSTRLRPGGGRPTRGLGP